MPYRNLPLNAFWRLCRETPDFRISELYAPSFRLGPGSRVATAGSCFAQNIGRYVRNSVLDLVDVEPAPRRMHPDVTAKYGYGLYSARYGNIYTARQLFQLLSDARTEQVHDCAVWKKGDRFFDALRPSCEPDGFADVDELLAHRLDHLKRVKRVFCEADVFVFTLGLTETWADRETGVVFPTAPGVIAGTFDPDRHAFLNLGFSDTLSDLSQAIGLMRAWAPGLRVILTVSPVPLTATASGSHVLQATTYSKSVLRSVAGELSTKDTLIDYFPSYEIITGTPFAGQFYDDNLRTVTAAGVQTVMNAFFAVHGSGEVPVPELRLETAPDPSDEPGDDLICEEALLEAFSRK